MNNKPMTGYLGLYVGCMYSGKTSRIIKLYNKYKNLNKEVCVINHSRDTRYHEELLSSHDKVMIPCKKVVNVSDVFKRDQGLLDRVDIYLINEGQFFPDLFEVVNLLVTAHKKTVYVCGLDGDFEMKKFGQLLDLIPLSDTYEKLYATCSKCSMKASFTKRLTKDTKQTLIGGDELYIPVCRKCYFMP